VKKNIIVWVLFSIIYMYASEVNVYSHRNYDVDKNLFKEFTKQTGIKVNIVKDKASKLIKRLEKEGKNTKADLLITVDVARLYKAKSLGLLKSIHSDKINSIVDKKYRDSDNQWFGLTKRARVIVYNKNKFKKAPISSYNELTLDKWKNKVLIRKSNNVYNQSLLASFIAKNGHKQAKIWAKNVVKNMARKPKGSDRDQMRAMIAEVGDLAVVNTYYIGKLIFAKKKMSDRVVGNGIGIVFPNQGFDESGTHINISGGGITKYAKNTKNAIKLMEFLLSKKAQEAYSSVNYEYPINKNAKTSKLLSEWGNFKEDYLDLEYLGKYNKDAVKIFNEVKWK